MTSDRARPGSRTETEGASAADPLLQDVRTLRLRIGAGDLDVAAIARQALRRIAALDRGGPALGALPVVDPRLLLAAAALDAVEPDRRGALHGVPVTVKDSFAVEGLTLAAGSPAFATLRASRDAIVVERLRGAGALVVGKTNMPPMAIGGGQAGVYGRTRSPYHREQLAAAWHSGSSIGSGVATAAGLGVVGVGEETVSSGRSPASNNALVAYTPSWGVVSNYGNWPLHPFRDVVVPHTRSMDDLLAVLAVIAGPHELDLWSRQDAIRLDRGALVDELRGGAVTPADPVGLRLGVPRLYLGEDIGPVRGIPLRPSIRVLWERAAVALRDAGVDLVPIDLPIVEAYEERGGRVGLVEAGYLPADWTAYELGPAMTTVWQRHLDDFGLDGGRLSDVNPYVVRPDPPFAVDAVESGRVHPGRDVFDYAEIIRAAPRGERELVERAAPALRGLDAARRELFEEQLAQLGLDGILFPANSDIGRWDAESVAESARAAWADGCVFSNGNHVWRRVGIPTVTLPMGLTADLGMPVGVTLAAAGGDDVRMLGTAVAIERILPSRAEAPLDPVDPAGCPPLLSDLDPDGLLVHASVLGAPGAGR